MEEVGENWPVLIVRYKDETRQEERNEVASDNPWNVRPPRHDEHKNMRLCGTDLFTPGSMRCESAFPVTKQTAAIPAMIQFLLISKTPTNGPQFGQMHFGRVE
jgi:hypothetical protein